jgi:hypothetical protein
MRRFLTCAALAALVLIGVSCVQLPAPPPGVSVRVLDASVVIMRATMSDVTDEGGNALAEIVLHPRCSGVAIGPHRVLTAQHCVTDNYGPNIFFATREQWERPNAHFSGVVIFADEVRDVAILDTAAELVFVPARVASFDELTGLVVKARHGFAVEHATLRADGHSDLAILHGDSGSPFFSADGSAVLALVVSCWQPVGSTECNASRGSEFTAAAW